jgi:phospholipase D1/2
MDGKPFEAGYHAATLRRYLWREHLGLLPAQDHDATDDPNAQPPSEESPNNVYDKDETWAFVEDPLDEKMWETWTKQATDNTEIFRHLFHADPDDHGMSSGF